MPLTVDTEHAVPWENIAPRCERERYRIYRLVGDDLQLLATTPTAEGVGVAICTLGEEDELRGCCLGVMDTMPPDREGPLGRWLANPFERIRL